MPFDPDAYLAAKGDIKPPGFDPDAYLASKSPNEIGATSYNSAKAAYEQGQPGAFYEAKPFNSGVASSLVPGERKQTNPVSPAESFAVGGIKGMTEMPLVGNLGQKTIESATGESMTGYNQAAAEQNPLSYAAGEGLLAIKGAPLLIGAGIEGVKQAGQAAGAGIKALANKVGPAVLKGAGKVLGFSGVPYAEKVSAILSNQAELSNPKLVKEGYDATKQALGKLGSDLVDTYKQVDKALPAEQLLSKADLKDFVLKSTEQAAKEGGSELSADMLPKLEKEFNRIVTAKEDAGIKPSQLWAFAKNAAEQSGKYRAASKFSPAAGTRADVLDQINSLMREKLYDYATQATSLTPDTKLVEQLSNQSKAYGEISNGHKIFARQLAQVQKPEVRQLSLDRAHEVLAKGPSVIGEAAYKKLSTAIRYGAVAVQRAYAELFSNDEDFRQAVGQ